MSIFGGRGEGRRGGSGRERVGEKGEGGWRFCPAPHRVTDRFKNPKTPIFLILLANFFIILGFFGKFGKIRLLRFPGVPEGPWGPGGP